LVFSACESAEEDNRTVLGLSQEERYKINCLFWLLALISLAMFLCFSMTNVVKKTFTKTLQKFYKNFAETL